MLACRFPGSCRSGGVSDFRFCREWGVWPCDALGGSCPRFWTSWALPPSGALRAPEVLPPPNSFRVAGVPGCPPPWTSSPVPPVTSAVALPSPLAPSCCPIACWGSALLPKVVVCSGVTPSVPSVSVMFGRPESPPSVFRVSMSAHPWMLCPLKRCGCLLAVSPLSQPMAHFLSNFVASASRRIPVSSSFGRRA